MVNGRRDQNKGEYIEEKKIDDARRIVDKIAWEKIYGTIERKIPEEEKFK